MMITKRRISYTHTKSLLFFYHKMEIILLVIVKCTDYWIKRGYTNVISEVNFHNPRSGQQRNKKKELLLGRRKIFKESHRSIKVFPLDRRMDVVCSLSNFEKNWRGTAGAYLIVCVFSIITLVNIVLLICVTIMKTSSKPSKYFLAKYLVGNILVCSSQVYGCVLLIAINNSDCTKKVIIYFSHQSGLIFSLTSLTVLTVAHYKYLTLRFFITPRLDNRILRYSVVAVIALDMIGAIFISIPIFHPEKISIGLSLSFFLILQICLVGICCFIQNQVTHRTNQCRFNAIVVKRSFGYLKATIWTTVVPRVGWNVIQYLTYYNVVTNLALARWFGISYLMSFIILPVLIIVKSKEIRIGFGRFATTVRRGFSSRFASHSRSLHIGERYDPASNANVTVPGTNGDNTLPCISTWVWVIRGDNWS